MREGGSWRGFQLNSRLLNLAASLCAGAKHSRLSQSPSRPFLTDAGFNFLRAEYPAGGKRHGLTGAAHFALTPSIRLNKCLIAQCAVRSMDRPARLKRDLPACTTLRCLSTARRFLASRQRQRLRCPGTALTLDVQTKADEGRLNVAAPASTPRGKASSRSAGQTVVSVAHHNGGFITMDIGRNDEPASFIPR